jgi:hypothetical protein
LALLSRPASRFGYCGRDITHLNAAGAAVIFTGTFGATDDSQFKTTQNYCSKFLAFSGVPDNKEQARSQFRMAAIIALNWRLANDAFPKLAGGPEDSPPDLSRADLTCREF